MVTMVTVTFYDLMWLEYLRNWLVWMFTKSSKYFSCSWSTLFNCWCILDEPLFIKDEYREWNINVAITYRPMQAINPVSNHWLFSLMNMIWNLLAKLNLFISAYHRVLLASSFGRNTNASGWISLAKMFHLPLLHYFRQKSSLNLAKTYCMGMVRA